MWHLLIRIGDAETALRCVSWHTLVKRMMERLEPLDKRVQQTIMMLASDATPDKPWACVGDGLCVKIRRLGEHQPVQERTDTMEQPDHSTRAHAQLGASSAYRWWACPGSINLINQLGVEDEPTIYAREGTAAHELAHLCLIKGQDAIEYIDREIDGFLVDDEMATAVQVYLDKCREYSSNPEWECLTEKKFSLKVLNPPAPMFGTADFVAINKRTGEIVVIDLKYGKGIVVEAKGNPQLKYYALGVICALNNEVLIRKIIAFIVQPRATGNPIKSDEYTPEDLVTWGRELLDHARATIPVDAPRAAGIHCRFCGASGRCEAQAEAAFASAQVEFTAEVREGEILPPERLPQIRTLTPQQLGAMKRNFPVLRSFMDAVDETLSTLIENGEKESGWKLVQDEGNRRWIDEENVAGKLTSVLGLGNDQTHETKLISPATAEKLAVQKLRDLGLKKKDAEPMVKGKLSELTVRPPTKPKLVPITDERPALPARGEEFDYEKPANAVSVNS